MADDLKKVGIVFRADGSEDFQKTLKDIGTAAKDNTNAFKKLTAEYDKNTTTTTKLQDKLDYASKQMATYQQRVETLQDRIKSITEEERKNHDALTQKQEKLEECAKRVDELKNSEDANSEALKAAQTEYNKTNKEVDDLTDKENKYNSQLKDNKSSLDKAQLSVDKYAKTVKECSDKLEDGSAKLADFGKKLEDIGGKAEKLGTNMTNNLTKPILAMGAASIAAWKQVDDAMDTVAIKTGATGDDLKNLQAIVTNMAETMPFKFQDIATAVGDVSTKFKLTGSDLQTTSQQFLEFAQINNQDVGESVSNVQQLLAAYGLTVADIPDILDQLNYTGQQTGIDMSSLSTIVADNAASLQSMGFSAQDAISFVGNLSLSGADTSLAMMGLKKALNTAAESGVPMSQALQDIQEKMVNASTTEQAVQAATDIFGQKSAAAIVNACRNGSLSFTDLATTASDSAGSLQTTFESITDPADNMQQELNKVQEAGSKLAEVALPVLLSILQTLTPIIRDFANWWKSLPAPMQEFIVKTLLVVAAAGPLIGFFGKIIGKDGIGGLITKLSEGGISFTGFGTIASTVISGISSGASALFALIVANPVVAIIGGIIIAILLLYANCKPFRDFCDSFFKEVSDFFANLLQPIEDAITSVSKFFGLKPKTALVDAFNNVVSMVKNTISWIENAIDKLKEFLGLKSDAGTGKGYASGAIVKFMAEGGVLNSPTVIGTYNGQAMVAGEAGAEAVLPLQGFYNNLDTIMKKYLTSSSGTQIYVNVDHINEVEDIIRIQKEAQQRNRMDGGDSR